MDSWQYFKDYYQILKVPYHASAEEIRSAYRQLCMEYHPDVSGGDTGMQMRLINEAYRTLGNPHRKREYDRRLFSWKAAQTPPKYTRPAADKQSSAPRPGPKPPPSGKRYSPAYQRPKSRPSDHQYQKTTKPKVKNPVGGVVAGSGILISLVVPWIMNSIPDLLVWLLILSLGYYLVEWILGLFDIRLGF